MPVQVAEFRRANDRFINLRIVSQNRWGEITAIEGSMQGILGGRNPAIANRPQRYHFYINVNNIKTNQIPEVWILDPPEENILHVNIWPPARCIDLNRDLPHVCWGGNIRIWAQMEVHQRQLLALLEMLRTVLNTQDFGSPAR